MDNDTMENEFVFSDLDRWLAGTAAVSCSIFGSSFNLITIFALLNHTPLRKHVTTPFVISLAASDLLFSLAVLPLMAIRFFAGGWIMGSTLCQIFPLLFYGNVAATLFNILAVTMNRWVMVYFPRKSDQIFTRRNSKIIIATCWTLPLLFMIPSLTGVWGRHELNPKTQGCTIVENDYDKVSFKMFLYNIGVSIPTTILIVTNIMIFLKIHSMKKELERRMKDASLQDSTLPNSLRKKEKQLTKMIIIIFVTFLLTYVPSYCVQRFVKVTKWPTTHILAYIVNWLSVVVNPLIYVATQEKYRIAILLLYSRVKFFRSPRKYEQEMRRPSFNKSQIRSSTVT